MKDSLFVAFGDQHVGSLTGLMPVNGVPLPNKAVLPPSPLQKEVAEHWDGFWRRRKKESNNIIAVNMADTIDGDHHDTVEIWAKPSDHVETAIEINKKVRAIAKRMYGVRGTSVHVGDEGDADDVVGRYVGYDKVDGNYTNYHLRLNVSGLIFDICHEGPNVGSRAWNRENQLRLYAKSIVMTEMLNGRKPPDVILRAHVHKKAHVSVEVEGHVCEAFITPSWQLKTEYAYKVANAEHISDIGGLVLRISGGKVVDWFFDCMEFEDTKEFVVRL